MDMNYLVQRRINAQKKYRRKVILTIVFSVILVVLILAGLIKVIVDEKKTGDGDQKSNTGVTGNITLGALTGTPNQDNLGDAANNEEPIQNGGTAAVATSAPVSTPTPTPIPRKKVAIDPGHGGEDLGSVRQGLYEKDANLAIALYLKKELEDAGYDVFMIRDSDTDVDNYSRPVLAIENRADVYVSIHLNSLDADSDATQGAETWYADLRNDGSDVFAQYVIDELTKVIDTRNRGIKLSNKLIVLKNADMMPACLVECGFITSETERNMLFNSEYQQKIAKGIANGIQKFLPIE